MRILPTPPLPPDGALLHIKGLYYEVRNTGTGTDLYLKPRETVTALHARARISRSGLYALKGSGGERYLYLDGRLKPCLTESEDRQAFLVKHVLRVMDELVNCHRAIAAKDSNADPSHSFEVIDSLIEDVLATDSPIVNDCADALRRRLDAFRAEASPDYGRRAPYARDSSSWTSRMGVSSLCSRLVPF